MIDSLSLLVIAFWIMAIVSVAGVALMHLSKTKKAQKGWFCFLVAWGVAVAWCNVMMIPGYMTGEICRAIGLGALGVAALLVALLRKKDRTFAVSKWVVTSSVVLGMADAFAF